jgi:hypothetical protein
MSAAFKNARWAVIILKMAWLFSRKKREAPRVASSMSSNYKPGSTHFHPTACDGALLGMQILVGLSALMR